jgi:hypothetical protein
MTSLLRGLTLATVLAAIPSASLAQLDSPGAVADFVYQKLPNLPLENQYIRTDTKKRAEGSTLVSRLVQYHTGVKGRSPLYRLDWKATLADYLGVNDYLQLEKYPGNAFLKSNPMERDRQLIQSLSLFQRNALIQALVDGFSGQSGAAVTSPSTSTPLKSKASSDPVRPTLQTLPQPGSVELLKPARPAASQTQGEARFLLP